MRRIIGLMVVLVLLKGACAMAADSNEVAVIETKFGKIVVEFYDKDALKTGGEFQEAGEGRVL